MPSVKDIARRGARWFLVSLDGAFSGGDVFDVHLTDYYVNKVPRSWELPSGKKISPLRNVFIKGCLIRPGHGEGVALIRDKHLKIRYAWGGLNLPGNHYRRTTYTVRVVGLGNKVRTAAFFEGLCRRIFVDEGGKLEETLSVRDWLRKRLKIRPLTIERYREYLTSTAAEDLRWVGEYAPDRKRLVKTIKNANKTEFIDSQVRDLQDKMDRGIGVVVKNHPTVSRLEPKDFS